MTDDTDDTAQSLDFHYDRAREPAQSRPGPRAPEPASREPVPPARDWDSLVCETRLLFRVARYPRHDELWTTRLEAQWLDWERWLVHWREKTRKESNQTGETTYALEDRLAITRRFLGRETHG
jgi:hypothetical protein